MVKMQVSEGYSGMTSVSFAGEQYTVRSDGTVDVPAAAVADLKSHGLEVHVPKQETKREKK